MSHLQPRHIDLDTVMLWRSLAKLEPARVNDLVEHWRPTFSHQDVTGMLQRLWSCGCVVHGTAGWLTTAIAPQAVPGIAAQPQAVGATA